MQDRGTLYLELRDTEWPFDYTDHDRQIVRAIVMDGEGLFYFVRAVRDDEFGSATLIETSGGGVEPGEDLEAAIHRELREELGVEVDVLRKLGVVSDYYNLIHRHNINHYFLCGIRGFGDRHLTEDERKVFHLSTLRLTYDEAVMEYEKCRDSRLGRLIANREKPILKLLQKSSFLVEGMFPHIQFAGMANCGQANVTAQRPPGRTPSEREPFGTGSVTEGGGR